MVGACDVSGEGLVVERFDGLVCVGLRCMWVGVCILLVGWSSFGRFMGRIVWWLRRLLRLFLVVMGGVGRSCLGFG
jgi:hypothetical protein